MEPSTLKLVMVQGLRKGETFKFVLGSRVGIARVVRGNNLSIKDSDISSKHFSIDSKSGKWVLRDLDSSNRTILNGSDMPPNTLVDLTNDDDINIGEYTSVEVRIAGYEESRRGRRGRLAKECEEISKVERANVKEIEIAGKRGKGRLPRARVLKTEAMKEKLVEENLAQQVSTRQTRSSRIEELGKIPSTAKTSTISDAGGGDGLFSIPQPSYQSGQSSNPIAAPRFLGEGKRLGFLGMRKGLVVGVGIKEGERCRWVRGGGGGRVEPWRGWRGWRGVE
ncbi:FHA domain-containing protein [Pyrus ussuriensis x Pyrus communis]|uniref:FHA domain-containing protein n=1 Tax=Pyrus ussuriensis x Pyrus communis TaxID=2448454 RepID=A0A5N5FYD8_9ROSA|nr:FHA domain-containing protein [Pyrus ussuriensis x Pyrus communis]